MVKEQMPPLPPPRIRVWTAPFFYFILTNTPTLHRGEGGVSLFAGFRCDLLIAPSTSDDQQAYRLKSKLVREERGT